MRMEMKKKIGIILWTIVGNIFFNTCHTDRRTDGQTDQKKAAMKNGFITYIEESSTGSCSQNSLHGAERVCEVQASEEQRLDDHGHSDRSVDYLPVLAHVFLGSNQTTRYDMI